MVKRWLLYLVALLGCIIFFGAYQGWVAWLMLLTVALAPLLSLALAVIPMMTVRPTFLFPGAAEAGQAENLDVRLKSSFPVPPCTCQFEVRHSISGTMAVLPSGSPLPTEHCGQVTVSGGRFYVYDYLGLFRHHQRRTVSKSILVRPKPLAVKPPKDLERFLSQSWRPKPGGGFSEQHELRLYRPGDSLNQIHWKLSAKTGKLTIREAMVPNYGRVLLTMELSGTPEEIDRKFGRLLWMGQYLLEQGLRYEIWVRTASGVEKHTVVWESDLNAAIDSLLCCTAAEAGFVPDAAASWQYHIGGEPDEA